MDGPAQVPLTLMKMAELMKEAGLPPGVLSVVHGSQAVAKATESRCFLGSQAF